MEFFRHQFLSLFDRTTGVSNHLIARWLYLRALGIVYFSAFFAFLFQVRGLVGTQGILPFPQYLTRLNSLGTLRFWYAPTLLWLPQCHSNNIALLTLCWAGLIASLLLLVNIAPRLALLICFIAFLSVISVSQDFGQYQSDGMLLEAGFLSLFVAPKGFRPSLGIHSLSSRAAWFLLLWEWFRIYFESGIVKLRSGDPTWRNFTAMYEYYQNGPLPTWIGWYLQHLPNWFHIATAVLTLVMELVLVWMAFLPGRWRVACFVIVTAWQIGVIATANYAFLNYLVLILAVLLLNDDRLRRFVPRRLRPTLTIDPPTIPSRPQNSIIATERAIQPSVPTNSSHWASCKAALSAVILTWLAYATTAQLAAMLLPQLPLPTLPVTALEPFRIANEYGLFANMTPHRYEIEFQGSNDGQTWTPYQFRFKPQDPHERPRIYAPYQPRFDWNLWFASLGNWQDYSFVPLTEERLLTSDKDVLALFRNNPFPSHPPRFVRAMLWQYWFSTPQEKRTHGVWWRRKLIGPYTPTLTQTAEGKVGIATDPGFPTAPQP